MQKIEQLQWVSNGVASPSHPSDVWTRVRDHSTHGKGWEYNQYHGSFTGIVTASEAEKISQGDHPCRTCGCDYN